MNRTSNRLGLGSDGAAGGGMSDALAIANLKAQYCATADLSATDPETARAQFAQIFTDDFVGDYGMEPIHGPQAITDFLCDAIAGGSDWMIHMLSSPHIIVEGDNATGDWTVHAHSKRKNGEMMEVIGRYSDAFRQTADGWRIAKVGFWRPE
jgi:ketosteroid isomerase-like protein